MVPSSPFGLDASVERRPTRDFVRPVLRRVPVLSHLRDNTGTNACWPRTPGCDGNHSSGCHGCSPIRFRVAAVTRSTTGRSTIGASPHLAISQFIVITTMLTTIVQFRRKHTLRGRLSPSGSCRLMLICIV